MKRNCLFCLGLILLLTPSGVWAVEEAVAAAELRVAIDRGAYYLHGQVNSNGSFVYRINTHPGVKVAASYNMLRHGGTQYALGQYHDLYRDPGTRRVLEKTGRFLLSQIEGSGKSRDNWLAVWSRPEVNHGNGPLQAKLGGTGLGLVALLGIERFDPNFVADDTLRQLGRFLVYMQKDSGQFCSKYIPSMGGRHYGWESLYYPGEAALGLVMLYEKDRDVLWLRTASRALMYLAKKRAGRVRVEEDHWALLATARLVPLAEQYPEIIDKETLLVHARQICNSMLMTYDRVPRPDRVYLGLAGDARTTPTATRLEGLLAAYAFLPEEERVLRHRIQEAAHIGMRFLLTAQIKNGKYKGGMPRAKPPVQALPSGKKLRFDSRATEIRIDYVQHALSAMIQYLDLFGENSSGN